MGADGEEIAPSAALLAGRAQQVGGVEDRHRIALHAIGRIARPPPALAHDARVHPKERFGRSAPMGTTTFGPTNAISRRTNTSHVAVSTGVGVRLSGGRQGIMLVM